MPRRSGLRRPLPRPLGTLRWRLTAWVAAVLVMSAGALFAVVYVNTGSQIRSQIDHDLAGDTDQLAQALGNLPLQTPRAVAAAAARYLAAQPFTVSSSLFFVIVPGRPTVSNHLEVFGIDRPERGEPTSDRARESAIGDALLKPREGYFTQSAPDLGGLRVLERSVMVGSLHVKVGAGEPLALVERAQHGVARAFLLAGAVALVLALIVSYFAGARVTAPLRRMAALAARVDGGDLQPRMDPPPGAGEEVRVLAESFNNMLDRLAEAFTGQREFVADASHELRTPLTVIRGQLEVLAAQPHPSGEEVRRVERLVQAEIARLGRLVDDLLTLTQAEGWDFLRVEEIDLQPFLTELWDGASLTAKRNFELGPLPHGALRADPDRLAQALRNLARNAVEHTAEGSGLVRLEVTERVGGRLRFAVCDDGPGIPQGERERIFDRFHRSDRDRSRATGGAGLGLAIVRAIVEAHGGEVRAGDAPGGGGACVEVVLPGFTTAPAHTRVARHPLRAG